MRRMLALTSVRKGALPSERENKNIFCLPLYDPGVDICFYR